MKKDFSPSSDPKCHTLLKAIHERIAHSSVWPRCECPWSARYSDGFHGRRLTGTNTPTWNEFPAEHFFFSSSDVRTFCSIPALAFSCPEPSRLIKKKVKARKRRRNPFFFLSQPTWKVLSVYRHTHPDIRPIVAGPTVFRMPLSWCWSGFCDYGIRVAPNTRIGALRSMSPVALLLFRRAVAYF